MLCSNYADLYQGILIQSSCYTESVFWAVEIYLKNFKCDGEIFGLKITKAVLMSKHFKMLRKYIPMVNPI